MIRPIIPVMVLPLSFRCFSLLCFACRKQGALRLITRVTVLHKQDHLLLLILACGQGSKLPLIAGENVLAGL